jgi:hypothetical protein
MAEAARNVCAGSTEPWEVCWPREITSRCRPALRTAHQTWLDQIQDSYDAAQTYFRALSKRMSGYAANLADEDAYAQALLQITELERSTFALIEQPALFWTINVGIYKADCVDQPEETTTAPTAAAAPDGPGACAAGLKSISVVAELGPTKVKINCEKVTQSIKWEVIPWLQAFAEVGYEQRSGKLTVMVGSKGELPLGTAKGAFKSGIYLTADRNGIKDVGWRVGPSLTVSSGPYEFQAVKDEMDLSFVGGLSSTFGI